MNLELENLKLKEALLNTQSVVIQYQLRDIRQAITEMEKPAPVEEKPE